jgi:hypothetical protein
LIKDYRFGGKYQPINQGGTFYGEMERVNLRAGHVTLRKFNPILIFF